MPPPESRWPATLVGFGAILMWSLLAALTAATGNVPPFQLAAMTFSIGGLLGLGWIAARRRWRDLRQSATVWCVGVAGLFGYHFLYFTALRLAPPVDASLINYLWPLLIVVLSALLPGEGLRWYHLAGVLLGLVGTVLVVSRGAALTVDEAFLPGYAAALAAAIVWSCYSVLSRRFAAVPTGAVAGFCMATAVLSLLAHLALEATVLPAGPMGWAAVLALGLMPVGAAFYLWDHGVKHGDIQVIGAFSYAAPIFSTAILMAAGFASWTWTVALAALLIAGGAALAARGLLRR